MITNPYLNDSIIYKEIVDQITIGKTEEDYEYYIGDDIYLKYNPYARRQFHAIYEGQVPSLVELNIRMSSANSSVTNLNCYINGVHITQTDTVFGAESGSTIRNLDTTAVIDSSSSLDCTGVFSDVRWYKFNITTQYNNDRYESIMSYEPIGLTTYGFGITNISTGLDTTSTLKETTLQLTNGTGGLLNLSNKIFYSKDTRYTPYIKTHYTYYNEISREVTVFANDQIVQYNNSSNEYKRFFLKFTLPTINGVIRYAWIKLNTDSVVDGETFVPIALYYTDDSGWTSVSDNTTMTNLFNSSDYTFTTFDSGILDNYNNYMFNAYGYQFTNISGYPPDVQAGLEAANNIRGVRWMYDNSKTEFTICFDHKRLTSTPDTALDTTSLKIGVDSTSLLNSERLTLKSIFGIDSTSPPIMYIGYDPPYILLSETTFEHYIVEGTNPTANDIFNIKNVGQGILNCSILESISWISTLPTTTGDLVKNANLDIDIIYDTTSLLIGDYTGVITIEDLDAEPTSGTVTILLHVVGAPLMQVSSGLDVEIIKGQNINDFTFRVWDADANILNTLEFELDTIHVTQSDELIGKWSITPNLSSSTYTSTDPNDYNEFTVSFNVIDVNPGSYFISFNPTDIYNNSEEIRINITVKSDKKKIAQVGNWLFT